MEIQQHLFVYGTLKLGQCRQNCWPLPPIQVRSAWTVGSLFDLGPYPAMITGDWLVAGQLWSYSSSDLPRVFEVLDQIEGTNQPGQVNLYDRTQIMANLLDGQSILAWTYLFANAYQLGRLARPVAASLVVDGRKYQVWPEGSTWPD